jgi:hypothetical protein
MLREAPKSITQSLQHRSESATKTAGYRHFGNLPLVPYRLQEDAQEALIVITRSVARGETLVRCQLLASLFYEELLRNCVSVRTIAIGQR